MKRVSEAEQKKKNNYIYMSNHDTLKAKLTELSKGKVSDMPVQEDFVDEEALVDDDDSSEEGVVLFPTSKEIILHNKSAALESAVELLQTKDKLIHDIFYHICENGSRFVDPNDALSSSQKLPSTDIQYKYIGGGNFGVITLFELAGPPRKRLVMKTIELQMPEDISDGMKEVMIMQRMSKYPQFLDYYSHFMKDNRFYIFMEYFEGNTLYDTVESLDADQKRNVFKQYVNGLLNLHNENIVHHDWNAKNFLVNGKLECKIIDFGWSYCFDDSIQYCFDGKEIPEEDIWRTKAPFDHMPKSKKITFLDLKLGDYHSLFRNMIHQLSEKRKLDAFLKNERTSDKFKRLMPRLYKKYVKEKLPDEVLADIELVKSDSVNRGTAKKKKKRSTEKKKKKKKKKKPTKKKKKKEKKK